MIKFEVPKTNLGDLRTPVEFIEYQSTSPEPNGISDPVVLYSCFAEVYNPSMKDIEIMKTNNVDKGITIKIRDPLSDYQPTNNHYVKINDYRYAGVVWNIEDIRHDFHINDYIVLVLGG